MGTTKLATTDPPMESLIDEFSEEKINLIIIIRMLQDFPGLKPQVKHWIEENS